ncbi:hypothetical protein BJY04DRAFT_3704 [Aspergillus karnatakaensis]|uniref:uncharacterized protein n=1 Tax=Aspergillus karnatakaensis TaxID=1810916 RepID=UPI003CCCEE45
MACAIAAAREAYKYPDWRPFAEICRDWANELLTPILCAGDTDTLVAITLLLVYELADPRRGIVWELLDLAARTCLQLGWHQTSHGSSSKKTVEHNVDTMSHTSLYSQGEINLMLVLRDIASSLQTVFNRPNMLRHLNLPHRAPQERLIELHIRTSDLIYGAGRLCEIKACPCVGEASILMGLLESVDRSHLVVKETWLLYLPLCLKHRQCVHCFQEPGEPTARGMTWLRRNLMKSASELIAEVHRDATLTEGFTPPIIASARSLIAGLAITTGIFKEWIVLGPHVRDIILCTEILTMFAPHWCGGQGYLRVWRTLLDHIQFGSLQLR